MRLSENGWSNDLPDKPGWYSFVHEKEWDWWPSSFWPMLLRVDFVGDKLMIVENPDPLEWFDEPLPHPLDISWSEAASHRQQWMNRAWKPLGSKADFSEDDLPDVSGNRGDAPDEFTYGDMRKTALQSG